jgi:AraC family transcriptional activator of mtrCDE
MDLLSRLLSLVPVTGKLDERCHFGSPWQIVKPEAGAHEIAYHVVLTGHAMVEDEHGAPQELSAGDIVLFPRGAAHRLHDGSGRKPRPLKVRQSSVLRVVETTGKGSPADVLCGRFILGGASDRLLRVHLPERVVVHSAGAEGSTGAFPSTRLARLIALMREEALDEASGAPTVV